MSQRGQKSPARDRSTRPEASIIGSGHKQDCLQSHACSSRVQTSSVQNKWSRAPEEQVQVKEPKRQYQSPAVRIGFGTVLTVSGGQGILMHCWHKVRIVHSWQLVVHIYTQWMSVGWYLPHIAVETSAFPSTDHLDNLLDVAVCLHVVYFPHLGKFLLHWVRVHMLRAVLPFLFEEHQTPPQ